MADVSVRNTSTEDSIDVRCFYSHIGPSGIHAKLFHCLYNVSACTFFKSTGIYNKINSEM